MLGTSRLVSSENGDAYVELNNGRSESSVHHLSANALARELMCDSASSRRRSPTGVLAACGGGDGSGLLGGASKCKKCPKVLDEEQPESYVAWFTYCYIAVACLMFLYELAKADWDFADTEENPMIGVSSSVLKSIGGKSVSDLVDSGEVYRLVVPIFMHTGLVHLAVTVLAMLRLGRDLENSFGFCHVAPIFLLSGVLGNIVSCLMMPQGACVGGTGPVVGLIGAMIGEFVQNHSSLESGKWTYLLELIASAVVGVAIGVLPEIDIYQHVGSLVGGVLLGMVLLCHKENGALSRRQHMKLIIALTTLVVLFAATLVILFVVTDPDESWCGATCKDIDCIPSAGDWWTCP